jgi:hypothetical protein
MTNQQWTAAYYPYPVVENQHSKTIICLLFDKLVCHFPVADMACGGGHGMSDDLYGDSPLVESGVIEVREEILLDEVPCDFTPGYYWGTPEENALYRRLQITNMTINECMNNGSIPITDMAETPIPATILTQLDLNRFAKLQASALAIQSLRIALPAFKEISDNEIMEAREKLKGQLQSFRNAMLTLSPAVRQGVASNEPLAEIQKEAKYIVETRVLPALVELKRKLELEKGKFWRRIVLQGSSIAPNFLINWMTSNALSAAIKAVDSSKEIALSLIQREETLELYKAQGGIGYLLEIVDHPLFKNK